MARLTTVRYVDPSKKAPIRKTTTQGRQGVTQCDWCGGEVTLKKATDYEIENSDVQVGDLILSQHREGGGRYSAVKGDARCRTSWTKASE